jgi:ABC-type dipeptide/oligopeptide/nickel transport system ATPase component
MQPSATSSPKNILEVSGLAVHFGTPEQSIRAVDGISFCVGQGETVALVGESGSGKSITALSLTRLAPPSARYVAGKIYFEGEDLLACPEARLRAIRGARISYVFQEPMTSFNPVFTLGWQIAEAIRLHQKNVNAKEEVLRLLDRVQLPKRVAQAYPHQMSGGQLQRGMIAMALACSPRLLVADEPTTALDVTVQREILNLLSELAETESLSILMITHNLGIVSDLAHRVYVMQKGRIVEHAETQKLLHHPEHAYTQRLMAAVPRLHPHEKTPAFVESEK